MIRYSVQPREQILVIGDGFLSFARKILSSKYGQNLLDQAKQSATDVLETASKRAIQKTAETTGDLIGNELASKIQEFQKLHHRKIEKQMNKEILREIYISPKKDKKLLMISD